MSEQNPAGFVAPRALTRPLTVKPARTPSKHTRSVRTLCSLLGSAFRLAIEMQHVDGHHVSLGTLRRAFTWELTCPPSISDSNVGLCLVNCPVVNQRGPAGRQGIPTKKGPSVINDKQWSTSCIQFSIWPIHAPSTR